MKNAWWNNELQCKFIFILKIEKPQHLHFSVFHRAFFNSVIDKYQHQQFLNYSVTVTRYRATPWWWYVKIETCRSTFKYFLFYFNFEINILDWYSVECEEVHVLVFINYYPTSTCFECLWNVIRENVYKLDMHKTWKKAGLLRLVRKIAKSYC